MQDVLGWQIESASGYHGMLPTFLAVVWNLKGPFFPVAAGGCLDEFHGAVLITEIEVSVGASDCGGFHFTHGRVVHFPDNAPRAHVKAERLAFVMAVTTVDMAVQEHHASMVIL